MALNGKRDLFPHRRRRKGDTAELSAQLAPPEEQQTVREAKGELPTTGNGSIVLDTGKLKLPKGFVAESKAESEPFRLEPVVLVILLLALLFIAFIAWHVYQMPAPSK